MTGVIVFSDAAIAIVVGTAFGIGVCLLIALAPRWGAPALDRRIAPYVRDVADAQGATPIGAVGTGSLRAVWIGASAKLGGLLGGTESVQRRLVQAGREPDVAAFRARQLAWGLGGLAGGGAIAVAVALAGAGSAAVTLLPPLAAALSVVLCDVLLTSAARARLTRLQEELPTVLEFLSLCLAAGEGLRDSIRRVGDVGSGELTAELRRVDVSVGMGTSLGDALRELSTRASLPALARSIDHLVAAIDRGAPLAQVLQAQAADAREDAKQALIERAGRNELKMLFPLVFIILPMSVIFAVFPGIFMLRFGLG